MNEHRQSDPRVDDCVCHLVRERDGKRQQGEGGITHQNGNCGDEEISMPFAVAASFLDEGAHGL